MADGEFKFDLNESFPHLPRTPIVEAVIHWDARALTKLDSAGLAAELSHRLPQFATVDPIHQVELTASLSGDAAHSVVQHQRDWRGIRLRTHDGSFIVQFTRDGLVFSRTREYAGWEPFVKAAKEAWQVYLEISKPVEIQRLGVRFINHFASATAQTLSAYLRDPPTCPTSLPLKELVYQSTFGVPGHPFGVRVIKVMQPSLLELKQSSGLFIDIDVFSTNAISNDPAALDDALVRMRWLKNKVFFTLMTERAVRSYS